MKTLADNTDYQKKMIEKLKGMAGKGILDISLKDLKALRHRRLKKHSLIRKYS